MLKIVILEFFLKIFKKNSKKNLFLFLILYIEFFLLKKWVGQISSTIDEININLKKKYKKYINIKLLKYSNKKFKLTKKKGVLLLTIDNFNKVLSIKVL